MQKAVLQKKKQHLVRLQLQRIMHKHKPCSPRWQQWFKSLCNIHILVNISTVRKGASLHTLVEFAIQRLFKAWDSGQCTHYSEITSHGELKRWQSLQNAFRLPQKQDTAVAQSDIRVPSFHLYNTTILLHAVPQLEGCYSKALRQLETTRLQVEYFL